MPIYFILFLIVFALDQTDASIASLCRKIIVMIFKEIGSLQMHLDACGRSDMMYEE